MAGKLVLTRRPQESITITTPDGSVIVVVIEEIDRNKVRVSVSAPLETKIFRTELLARMTPSEIEKPLDN